MSLDVLYRTGCTPVSRDLVTRCRWPGLVAFRLGEVVIELTLPPEPEADPARRRAAGRIIDAFTDRPFGGNPAAVCLLDDADAWPDEA